MKNIQLQDSKWFQEAVSEMTNKQISALIECKQILGKFVESLGMWTILQLTKVVKGI